MTVHITKSRKPNVIEGLNVFYTKDVSEIMEYVINKNPNPEQIAINNDMVKNISQESKEVIHLILNLPTELMENVINKKKQKFLTVNDIYKYLKNQGWKDSTWIRVKQELVYIVKKF